MVEQVFCRYQIIGSIPIGGSTMEESNKMKIFLDDGKEVAFHSLDLGNFGVFEVMDCGYWFFDTPAILNEKDLNRIREELLNVLKENKCVLHLGNRDKYGRCRKNKIRKITNVD